MPTLRKRSRTLETPATPNHNNQINNGDFITQSEKTVSGYEESREKRIKENLERMQKLGIFDLSLKLKSSNTSNKLSSRNHSVKKTPNGYSPLQALEPTRRSSRLQNVTPVSYVEVHKAKKEGSFVDDILLEEGLRPEIYTEKHEKLLGDCKMSWTLFVDGYGKDGKRIYDSFNGKTCHQCRQKTLGHRTHCSQCNMIQGQFCGDCLYMRYGENVLEATQNPNWICPVCRGICNCSLCRKAKGWAPTGYLYRKVSSLGFKSVAHYLIETRRRSPENLGNNPGTKTPLSAKRSLPFSDMEAPPSEVNDDLLGVLKPQSEDKRDAEFKVEENTGMHCLDNGDCNTAPRNSQNNKELKDETLAVNRVLDNISARASLSEKGSELFTIEVNKDHLGLSTPQSKDRRDYAINMDIKIEPQKPTYAHEPSPDSIGGRLRQRRKEDKSHEGKELIIFSEETMVANKSVDIISGEMEAYSNAMSTFILEPNPDSIGGRLRKRRNEEKSHEGKELIVFSEETVVAKKTVDIISWESEAYSNVKLSDLTEPSPDSIAGRLRSRRERT